ncbi:MAG: ATP-binding protein [Geobacteraceae bacterium]|jgi:PAS domain S-box-containing protein
MISPNSFIKLKESFRAKVLFLCILFIVIVSFSFTIFFILHESNTYQEQLVNEGNLLASLLAYNSRLAVFAENRETLQAAAEGITKNKNVISVTIFAANGELLAEVNKDGTVIDPVLKSAEETKRIRALLGDTKSSSFSRNRNDIAFYSQIISETVYPTTESLYFKEKTKPPEYRAIGLARIVLEKTDLNRRVGNLLLVGILFLTLFLFLGIAGVYKVLSWITEPLDSLMEGVRTVGKGDLSRRIPIETADEIGKVAVAFNAMAETLERREAEKMYLEEQLRLAQKMEAKAEWERTFDTVTDLIAIIDREQRIVQVNEAMAQRFRITKEEAAGKRCFELFHDKISADAGCPCLRLLKDGREHETGIYETRLDSHFWITVTPLRKSSGELIGCVHVARDISEWKRAEEEKKTIQAKLIQTNKMTSLGLLVSGMAHEVNNPNNSIKFTAHVLAKAWNDMLPILDKYFQEEGDFVIGGHHYSQLREAFPQLISGITDSSRRIEGIITNLRDFVRKGKADLSMQTDINRIVSVSASILNNQIKMHTYHFRIDLSEGMPEIRGNSQQLEQVVINLIMNALQSLPDKERSVSVSTCFDEQAGQAVIKVSDNGCGMSADVKNRLFEPFYSTKLDSGGTGLGLAISNVIIMDHRGVLEFDSEPGKGTTAIVKLPVA